MTLDTCFSSGSVQSIRILRVPSLADPLRRQIADKGESRNRGIRRAAYLAVSTVRPAWRVGRSFLIHERDSK
jgi:hypothetical protein